MSLRPSSRSQTCNLNPRCLPTCVAFGGSAWIPSHQGCSALLERPLFPLVKHPRSAAEASAELTMVLTGRPGATAVCPAFASGGETRASEPTRSTRVQPSYHRC